MRIQVTGETEPDAIDVAGGQPATVIEVTSGAVSSVNGKTGAVALTAADVGALPTSGGGALVIDRFGAPAGYPIGPTGAVASLNVVSSYAGGDDNGTGTDSTGRINLYSYQRANSKSFGENIRNFAMRSDAKTMQAFYIPVDASKKGGYDPASRDPKSTGVSWKPVVWQGAHYEANSHDSIHGHWELEIADSTGALQGRLEIPFIDQLADGTKPLDQATIGVDYTNIRTNLADFSVRAQNITSGPYSGTNTCLRVGGANDRNKDIALSIGSDMGTSQRRWILRANTTTESSTATGTDFQILRYDNTGSQIGTALGIERSTGNITLGAAPGGQSSRMTAVWNTSGQHGYSAIPSATPGSAAAFDAQMTVNTDRALQATVAGDANRRLVIFTDGKHEWGDGTLSRDTNLYRSNPGVLKTDGAVQATTSLRLNTTSLGSGVGVVAMANATTAPSGTPSGGGVLYASAGLPRWKGSDGVDYDLARGQFPVSVVRKTVDEIVTNSIAVQDDDQLTLAVAANGVYLVDAFLMYDGDTAGDFRVTFSGPSGASMDWTPNGLATSQVSGSASIKLERQNLNGESTLGASGAGSKAVALPRGLLIVGGTAGNLTVRWAQATASATATTLFANSWLRLTKIA